MLKSLRARITGLPRELIIFIIASFAVGMAGSLVDSVFNNYLDADFALSGFQRSFLELPRELPGFLVLFAAALLWFLDSRRLGAISLVMTAVGIFLVGAFEHSYISMILCVFMFSMGLHLFMPVATTIGMELAAEGRTAQRLGQFNAIRNLAVIVGSGLVYMGFKFLHFSFSTTFIIAAVIYGTGALLVGLMKPSKVVNVHRREFVKLRKEYSLFYALSVLSGARKQIFMTFAPWVIVTIYNKPTQTIATLVLIGGVLGILFQPLLGRLIDKVGERVVLMSEAVLLVPVCLAYGFSGLVFSENTAFFITCVCYLIDQILMSVGMARSTYMKKIAMQSADIQPALSAALSIDHFFSIGVALIGGVIWNKLGFQYVFLFGVFIAIINFFTAMRVQVPKKEMPGGALPEPVELK